ncbi:very short patch repair endonuclease [Chitinophaga deserti]|uniref:very short patch repair endonuclease n=1 Tax=Chitinophaga deserti TaxID=2164099 RepID=UPI001E5FD55C|nr:very short patch repair endonuclease [Chitinophaga deserti]
MMTDTFSKAERRAIMQKVKSKGNKSTEGRLLTIFKNNNIKGWRRNYPLKGNPDFVFPRKKLVVFTDGCFWHGHYCRNIVPKQNADYWNKKRQRNVDRDKEVIEYLKKKGWVVLRFWECEIGTISLTV